MYQLETSAFASATSQVSAPELHFVSIAFYGFFFQGILFVCSEPLESDSSQTVLFILTNMLKYFCWKTIVYNF